MFLVVFLVLEKGGGSKIHSVIIRRSCSCIGQLALFSTHRLEGGLAIWIESTASMLPQVVEMSRHLGIEVSISQRRPGGHLQQMKETV